MQFGEVAAVIVLFRFGERNMLFLESFFEINPLFKIRGHVPITDFEDKYFYLSQILRISIFKSINFYICQNAGAYHRQRAIY